MEETQQRPAGRLWRKSLTASEAARAQPGMIRAVVPADVDALGALFHDAFDGTRDATGFTREAWVAKARAMLSGRYGAYLSSASAVLPNHEHGLAAACIVTDATLYGTPLIAIVAVRVSARRAGHASRVTTHALASLRAAGYQTVCAKISDDNTPSESLFAKLGFTRGEPVD
jgi:ribosomal protein S18 acetylase RimI-like enzyme